MGDPSDVTAAQSTQRQTRLGGGVRVVLIMVAVMWVSELVDTLADNRLDQYGIEPRDTDGLVGIPAARFSTTGSAT